MKLYVHIPVRNEAGRYLEACLSWASTFADAIHVYDDDSDDDTRLIADKYAAVSAREGPPSFADHEGLFRQGAWNAFEDTFRPDVGDWVLALDADEFLVGTRDNIRPQLEELIGHAERNQYTGIEFPVIEIFDATFGDEMTLQRRTDKYWRFINEVRLFPYQVDALFAGKDSGCGSRPTYADQKTLNVSDLWLLHLGYARPEDRRAKYDRYLGTRGHNPTHVASIIQAPTLEPWSGFVPPIWTGERP